MFLISQSNTNYKLSGKDYYIASKPYIEQIYSLRGIIRPRKIFAVFLGRPFLVHFFGQLNLACKLDWTTRSQNLTGQSVFTYFDTGVTILAIHGGKGTETELS